MFGSQCRLCNREVWGCESQKGQCKGPHPELQTVFTQSSFLGIDLSYIIAFASFLYHFPLDFCPPLLPGTHTNTHTHACASGKCYFMRLHSVVCIQWLQTPMPDTRVQEKHLLLSCLVFVEVYFCVMRLVIDTSLY